LSVGSNGTNIVGEDSRPLFEVGKRAGRNVLGSFFIVVSTVFRYLMVHIPAVEGYFRREACETIFVIGRKIEIFLPDTSDLPTTAHDHVRHPDQLGFEARYEVIDAKASLCGR